jgi:hypothetical protein
MQSKTADLNNLEKMGFFGWCVATASVVRLRSSFDCSDTGVFDREGRKVFLFLAGRFAVSSIPPSQLLLFIIRLLDEASARAFSVVYCHTSCGELCSCDKLFLLHHLTSWTGLSNLPSPQVVKNIYDSLTRQWDMFDLIYLMLLHWCFFVVCPSAFASLLSHGTVRYKKNFKALYVVHSTWTFKVNCKCNYCFITFWELWFHFQAALALSTTLVSPKFSKKIVYCSKLDELQEKLGLQIDVPNFVV